MDPSKLHVAVDQKKKFEYARKRAGLVLAPLVFLVVWWLPIPGLADNAHRLLAIAGLTITLWATEAIPLPIAALLGPVLCVAMAVAPTKAVFQGFSDPIIFVFLGSFMLAEAMFVHGLNKRIAYRILGLKWVGESPLRLLLAFGGTGAFLSMWISNTLCTAMLCPVALTILAEMARRRSIEKGVEVRPADLRFGTGLILLTGFGPAVGGMGTPIGTPPNLIAVSLINQNAKVPILFFDWVMFTTPILLILLVLLVVYLNRVYSAEAGVMRGSVAWIQAEQAKLGPMSRAEKNVTWALAITGTLWLLPSIPPLLGGTDSAIYQYFSRYMPTSVAAIIGATLLFVLPVDLRTCQFTLSWKEAKQIDFGTILLFGGGLALGDLMFTTGLSEWVGGRLSNAMNTHTTLGLVTMFTLVSAAISQVASNTAAAAMVVPIAIAVAQAAGVNAVQPALAAALGASLGCMLPISTPPMAIVYSSGCVPLGSMAREGFVVLVVGAVVVIASVMYVVPAIIPIAAK